MPKIYFVFFCDFKCCKQSNMDIHTLSRKHKKNEIEFQKNAENKGSFFCDCEKEYKFRQGLWKHKKNVLHLWTFKTPIM